MSRSKRMGTLIRGTGTLHDSSALGSENYLATVVSDKLIQTDRQLCVFLSFFLQAHSPQLLLVSIGKEKIKSGSGFMTASREAKETHRWRVEAPARLEKAAEVSRPLILPILTRVYDRINSFR